MTIVTIPGKQYDSNVYLLSGKKPAIVDTGTGFHSKELISQLVEHIRIEEITQIILTHEHYDHVGGVPELLHALQQKATILAHQHAVPKLFSGKSSFASLLGGTMPKITVDTPLQGGEHLLLGDEQFEVLYTPGHSIGSLCLYSKTSQSLISGDTVFAYGDYGRYDLPTGDFNALQQSIDKLATLSIQNLYPGHGETIQGEGNSHLQKTYQNIHQTV